MHRVVRPFPFSEDGFTLIDLAIGDERDFAEMAVGLEAEGFIEPAKGKPDIEVKPLEFAASTQQKYETKPAPRRGRPRK